MYWNFMNIKKITVEVKCVIKTNLSLYESTVSLCVRRVKKKLIGVYF